MLNESDVHHTTAVLEQISIATVTKCLAVRDKAAEPKRIVVGDNCAVLRRVSTVEMESWSMPTKRATKTTPQCSIARDQSVPLVLVTEPRRRMIENLWVEICGSDSNFSEPWLH